MMLLSSYGQFCTFGWIQRLGPMWLQSVVDLVNLPSLYTQRRSRGRKDFKNKNKKQKCLNVAQHVVQRGCNIKKLCVSSLAAAAVADGD